MKNTKENEFRKVSSESEVMRFLVTVGFTDASMETLQIIAKLMIMNMENEKLIMKDAYKKLAKPPANAESLRARIGYNIKLNYKKVSELLKRDYNFYIDEHYYGIKNFIEQLVVVFSLLVDNSAN